MLGRGVHRGGIIPARAGFTGLTVRLNDDRRGSSPLARGLLETAVSAASQAVDHPRSRGVYRRRPFSRSSPSGSSPLARGLHDAPAPDATGPGIIPARAGFTVGAAAAFAQPQDHPRSRGVYPSSMAASASTTGSSPLARGLPGGQDDRRGGRGIIPARAGFTENVTEEIEAKGDHPRSRGVYGVLRLVGDGARWIIPARAGFTAL